MLKKTIKKTSTNQTELKQAYELVAQDLFSALKKAKDGAKIKLDNLGYFSKKLTKVANPYGGFQYYRISFKVAEKLRGRNL
jgi:nucleoid DNA-binding protein